jgi:hypothetical protein
MHEKGKVRSLLNLLYGFAPWIVLAILPTRSLQQLKVAIVIALILTVVLNLKYLRKGFVLVWGALLFCVFNFVVLVLLNKVWFAVHMGLLVNIFLTAIVWISLLINKPFTLQYAREQVDPKRWNSPRFIRINQLMTMVWGVIFLFNMGVNIIRLYHPENNHWFYVIILNLTVILGFVFNEWFPNWYKQRIKK